MIIFRFSLVASASLALASCADTKVKQDDAICLTPPTIDELGAGPVSTPEDQAKLNKACVHRWAYRLAGAPGSNNEIAKAVLGACREAVMIERNLYLKEGETTTVEALEQLKKKLEADYLEMAFFHVVQARAGNCTIPQ